MSAKSALERLAEVSPQARLITSPFVKSSPRLMALPSSPQSVVLFNSPQLAKLHSDTEVFRRLSEERLQRDQEEEAFLRDLEQQINELNEQNAALSHDKVTLSAELSALQSALSHQKSQMAFLAAALETTRSELDAEKDRTTKARRAETQTAESLEKQLAGVRDRLRSSEDELHKMKRQANETESHYQQSVFQLQERLSRAEAEVTSLRDELAKKGSELSAQQSLLASAATELNNAQALFRRGENEHLAKGEAYAATVTRLKKELSMLKESAEQAGEREAKMSATLKTQSDELRKKAHRATLMDKELEATKAELRRSLDAESALDEKLRSITTAIAEAVSRVRRYARPDDFSIGVESILTVNPLQLLKDLAESAEQLATRMKKTQSKAERQKEEVAASESKATSAAEEARTLRQELKEALDNQEKLRFSLLQLQTEGATTNGRHASLQRECETLATTLETERKDFRAKAQDLQFQLDEMRSQLEARTNEAQQLGQKTVMLNRQLAEMKEDAKQATSLVALLRTELSASQGEIQTLVTENQRLGEAKQKLSKRIVGLSDENKKMHQDVAAKREEALTAAAKCRELEQQLTKRGSTARGSQDRLQALERERDNLLVQVRLLKQEPARESIVAVRTIDESQKRRLEQVTQLLISLSRWCFSPIITLLSSGTPAGSAGGSQDFDALISRVENEAKLALSLVKERYRNWSAGYADGSTPTPVKRAESSPYSKSPRSTIPHLSQASPQAHVPVASLASPPSKPIREGPRGRSSSVGPNLSVPRLAV